MKVLIIAVNREKQPYPVQPLGALCVTEALRASGHDARLLDLCFVDDYRSLIKDTIRELSPSVIGISIRNIDNTAFPHTKYYLPYVKEVVDLCKAISKAKLIIGGSAFSVMPKYILEFLGSDLGLIGEGENNICELVKSIEEGESFADIAGVTYIRNEKYYQNKPHHPDILKMYCSPRMDLDVDRYYRDGSIINIQTKRGCKFNCIYCTYPNIEGKKVRVRNPLEVIEEIKFLNNKYGINYFFFVDSIFNYPIEHAIDICDKIIESDIKIGWTAFFHPKFITKELVNRLKKAGCFGVELGLDTASEKMLKTLKKGFTVADIIGACRLCKGVGLNTCCYLLLGGPGEDDLTIRESFENLVSINPTAIIVLTGIRIYPNTELEDIAIREGYSMDDPLTPQFYISEKLKGKIINIINDYMPRHSNLIYEGISKDIPIETLQDLRKRGFNGPIWELKAME